MPKLRVSTIRSELRALSVESRWDPERDQLMTLGRVYERQPSLIGNSANIREHKLRATYDLIKMYHKELCGPVHRFERPEGVSPLGIRCSAVAWLDRAMTQCDGFLIVNAQHGLGRSILSSYVSAAIVSSTFFNTFYIVFTADSANDSVIETARALDTLKASTIAVIQVGEKGGVLRNATGTPVPDRRDQLKDILRRGHWS